VGRDDSPGVPTGEESAIRCDSLSSCSRRRAPTEAMGITGAWLVAVVVAGVVVALIVLRAAWARHLRRYGVGPVDVVPPSNGTGESDDLVRPLAQAAVIVSRLAGDGLYPAPALPSGAMATGLIDVVQASPISEARWIGTILSYLKDSFARRPTGFRLAGTLLRGDESPSCGYLAQNVCRRQRS